MGSLASRPKAPAAPQVVYYAPAPVTPVTSAPSQPSSTPATPAETPEQAASKNRTASLLQRGRGIFGTVRTGFRGLLDLADNSASRKTLLGE